MAAVSAPWAPQRWALRLDSPRHDASARRLWDSRYRQELETGAIGPVDNTTRRPPRSDATSGLESTPFDLWRRARRPQPPRLAPRRQNRLRRREAPGDQPPPRMPQVLESSPVPPLSKSRRSIAWRHAPFRFFDYEFLRGQLQCSGISCAGNRACRSLRKNRRICGQSPLAHQKSRTCGGGWRSDVRLAKCRAGRLAVGAVACRRSGTDLPTGGDSSIGSGPRFVGLWSREQADARGRRPGTQRGANAITAIPSIQRPAPRQSPIVGRIPSTSHNQPRATVTYTPP